MSTASYSRRGRTLVVLVVVAAIAVLATVRLSASDARPPAPSLTAPATRMVSTGATIARRSRGRAARTHSAHTHPSAATAARPVRPHAPLPATMRVPRAGRLIRTLRGTGSRALGSLRERRGVVLQWHAAGHPFQIYTTRGVVLVSSRDHAGSIGLTRGDYRSLRVATPGSWTIRLSRQR
jgi:hypothetical protein